MRNFRGSQEEPEPNEEQRFSGTPRSCSPPNGEESRRNRSDNPPCVAGRVYSTDYPTEAQLSAIRRAVAKLVAEGHAYRGLLRATPYDGDWLIDLPRKTHERGGFSYQNPGGVIIWHAPDAADEAADPEGAKGAHTCLSRDSGRWSDER